MIAQAVQDYQSALQVIRVVYQQILNVRPDLEQAIDSLESQVLEILDQVQTMNVNQAQSIGQKAIQIMIAEGTGILSVSQVQELLNLKYRLLSGSWSGDFMSVAVADVQDLGQNPVPEPEFESKIQAAESTVLSMEIDVQTLVTCMDTDAQIISDIGQIIAQTGPAANYSPEAVEGYMEFSPVLEVENPGFLAVVTVVQDLQQQGIPTSEIASELRAQRVSDLQIYQRFDDILADMQALVPVF